MLVLSWVATTANVSVWQLVILGFAVSSLTVFGIPAQQALVMDTVQRDFAPNAMALNATAGRACSALGALVAGVVIPSAGVPACYVASAVAYATAASLASFARTHESLAMNKSHIPPPFSRALTQAARLIVDVPTVRTLIMASIACEVFAFSFITAVPPFARDVLAAGAEGLGTLNAALSLGGALAVVALSLVPARIPRQPVLGVVFLVFGASGVLLAQSRELPIAAAVLLVTGACAGSFDLLQQTLIQLAVPEEQRGRAVGVWVFAIGSAPLGHLEMGTLVATLGAPAALSINGGLVLVAAATLLARAPSYRLVLRPKIAT
jgi:predicted MFS family arabinose efflux permease